MHEGYQPKVITSIINIQLQKGSMSHKITTQILEYTSVPPLKPKCRNKRKLGLQVS